MVKNNEFNFTYKEKINNKDFKIQINNINYYYDGSNKRNYFDDRPKDFINIKIYYDNERIFCNK